MLSWRSLNRRNDMEEDRHSSRSGSATMPAKFFLAHNLNWLHAAEECQLNQGDCNGAAAMANAGR